MQANLSAAMHPHLILQYVMRTGRNVAMVRQNGQPCSRQRKQLLPVQGSPYNYDECWVLASGSANCSSSQHESGANSLYIYGNGSQSIAALPEFDESIENLQITFDD
jgi:hypothetical protein